MQSDFQSRAAIQQHIAWFLCNEINYALAQGWSHPSVHLAFRPPSIYPPPPTHRLTHHSHVHLSTYPPCICPLTVLHPYIHAPHAHPSTHSPPCSSVRLPCVCSAYLYTIITISFHAYSLCCYCTYTTHLCMFSLQCTCGPGAIVTYLQWWPKDLKAQHWVWPLTCIVC